MQEYKGRPVEAGSLAATDTHNRDEFDRQAASPEGEGSRLSYNRG
jgi:hypothetical protein